MQYQVIFIKFFFINNQITLLMCLQYYFLINNKLVNTDRENFYTINIVSIDEIEQMTEINFLPDLEANDPVVALNRLKMLQQVIYGHYLIVGLVH